VGGTWGWWGEGGEEGGKEVEEREEVAGNEEGFLGKREGVDLVEGDCK